jgi:hypothetical protein
MRIGFAQRLSHPYRLRTLAGKNKADSFMHKGLDIFEMPWKVNGKSWWKVVRADDDIATTLLTPRPRSVLRRKRRPSPEIPA